MTITSENEISKTNKFFLRGRSFSIMLKKKEEEMVFDILLSTVQVHGVCKHVSFHVE